MTIQQIGGSSVALYITPDDLKTYGLSAGEFSLERALELTETAFDRAGISLSGTWNRSVPGFLRHSCLCADPVARAGVFLFPRLRKRHPGRPCRRRDGSRQQPHSVGRRIHPCAVRRSGASRQYSVRVRTATAPDILLSYVPSGTRRKSPSPAGPFGSCRFLLIVSSV